MTDANLLDVIVPACASWIHRIRSGQALTIVDLCGNQAVDFLMYSSDDESERYCAQDTIAAQRNIFLREGAVLLSNEGRPMMTIEQSDVARHDTIGGACSSESNTVRYGHFAKSEHSCVDNFLGAGARQGLTKRDIVPNINFFMNVPVEADGTLGIVDGISAPGLSVRLRAKMDVTVVISNCPQINNPCNGFDPTPIRLLVTE
jgi:urea carboxylase-associated protein 1